MAKEMTAIEMKAEIERLRNAMKQGKVGRKEMVKGILLADGVGSHNNKTLSAKVAEQYGGDRMSERNVSSILCYIKDDTEFNGGFYRKGGRIWWDVKK